MLAMDMGNTNKRMLLKRGFTLIEILTVLAIIAILSAMLFSVFSRVRANGHSAVCQNNLRQIYFALRQYTDDNDGNFPLYKNLDGDSWVSSLEVYIKEDQVFKCPSVPFLESDFSAEGRAYMSEKTTYYYNKWRLNVFKYPGFPTKGIKANNEVALPYDPSKIWVNFCRNLPNRAVFIYSSCKRTMTTANATMHFGGTNVSFLDGHIRWLKLGALAEIDCSNPPVGDHK